MVTVSVRVIFGHVFPCVDELDEAADEREEKLQIGLNGRSSEATAWQTHAWHVRRGLVAE